jgi:hypothetical protein
MGCPTRIVPGLDESSKIKNPALAVKINSMLDSKTKKTNKKKK